MVTELENSECVELKECEFVHETDKAVLVWIGDQKIWFPKSQLMEFDEYTYKRGDEIDLVASDWIMEEKGLV